MISYVISQNNLIVRVNDFTHYNSVLSSVINLSSACGSMNIGYKSFNAINFFMWNFIITSGFNEYLNYFDTSGSTRCFIGSCTCPIAMKLDDLGIGCASEITDISKNSIGDICSQTPCRGNYKIDCLCSSKSCSFDIDDTAYCIDYVNNKFNATLINCNGGGQGCAFCLLDCKTCNDISTCSSCVNPLAIVNSSLRCQCKDGFYSVDNIVVENSCKLCPIECLRCLSPTECTACNISNSVLIQGK